MSKGLLEFYLPLEDFVYFSLTKHQSGMLMNYNKYTNVYYMKEN